MTSVARALQPCVMRTVLGLFQQHGVLSRSMGQHMTYAQLVPQRLAQPLGLYRMSAGSGFVAALPIRPKTTRVVVLLSPVLGFLVMSLAGSITYARYGCAFVEASLPSPQFWQYCPVDACFLRCFPSLGCRTWL